MVGVDWIHLAQGRDKLFGFVNTTMNFGSNKIGRGWISCVAGEK